LVIILACLAEIFKPRMISHLLHGDGANFLCYEAGESFMKPHTQCADALGSKTDRSCQDKRRSVGFKQVRRTHVGLKTAGNHCHDIHQRLGRLAGLAREISDFVDC
jgi:hypothetical protein